MIEQIKIEFISHEGNTAIRASVSADEYVTISRRTGDAITHSMPSREPAYAKLFRAALLARVGNARVG